MIGDCLYNASDGWVDWVVSFIEEVRGKTVAPGVEEVERLGRLDTATAG